MHGFRCYDNSAEREMSVSACTCCMPGSVCRHSPELVKNLWMDFRENWTSGSLWHSIEILVWSRKLGVLICLFEFFCDRLVA